MKKKAWITSPMFVVGIIIMFLMAFLDLRYDRTIFFIELFLAILFSIYAVLSLIWFKKYVTKVVKSSLLSISVQEKANIERMPFPAVIIGEFEDIVYYNTLFKEEVSSGNDCLGIKINNITGYSVEEILRSRGLDISFAGKRYTVLGFANQGSAVLFFFEDTYYKEIASEYEDSRPVVAFAVFDNKDEILSNAEDYESAQIEVRFEHQLQRWISNTTGFFKRIGSNRYMMIFEERHLRLFEQEKFKILEEIREIKLDKRIFATASIGIGRGGRTIKESEQWARKSLEMALGRGGDQVAIHDKNGYSFFGGISKGTQRSERVRTRIIANAITEQIRLCDNVLIMGHAHSDLDSIGAAIGLWSAIQKGLGCRSNIVVDKNKTLAMPLIKKFSDIEYPELFVSEQEAQDLINDQTLLILVDTHMRSFLEYPAIYDKCKKVIVIDHHRLAVNMIENSVVFFHDPYASSTCEMVSELVQYMGASNISAQEAEAMLCGIMLDTKNFVLKTGVKTFEAAAFLKKRGADSVASKRMFSNSIETYKERYELLSLTEIFKNFAISVSEEEGENLRIPAAQVADELLGVEGIRASFVIYKEKDRVNISARSLEDVNVQLIMEKMGGGGHQSMAGAQISGKTVGQVRDELKSILSEIS